MNLKGYTEQEITKIINFWVETASFGGDCDVIIEPVCARQGDGMQLASFTPLATRPYYYILRVDSAIDLGADYVNEGEWDEMELPEMLLELIESEYETSDTEPFPALDTSCGYTWGKMPDVGRLLFSEKFKTD